MKQKYVTLTYIGTGVYSDDKRKLRYMDKDDVLFEEANLLVANFPKWWEIGRTFEYDSDEEAHLKYVGEKPYSGDSGVIKHNECITATEGEVRQLLKDFPNWWVRIDKDGIEGGMYASDEEFDEEVTVKEHIDTRIMNKVSIIITPGDEEKLTRLLGILSEGSKSCSKYYDISFTHKGGKYVPRYEEALGISSKDCDWVTGIKHAISQSASDFLWFLDGDTILPTDWSDHVQRMVWSVEDQWIGAVASLVAGVQEGELSINWLSILHPDEYGDIAGQLNGGITSGELDRICDRLIGREAIYNVEDLPVQCLICNKDLFEKIGGIEGNRQYKGADLAIRFQEAGYQCLGYTNMIAYVRSYRECIN